MFSDRMVIREVCEAKTDTEKADDLIRAYIPFIRSEAAKCMGRFCTEQDDEYSIAMMAFYEAIMSYEKMRGAFLHYAATVIRSRLIDYNRKEKRQQGHLSFYEGTGPEDGCVLADTLAEESDPFEERAAREATRQEIEELRHVLEKFGVSFSDVAENCPKQERTLRSCAAAIRYGAENKALLAELLRTQKLPMAQLVCGAGVERKTLERHRKYILAMLLIQTNGFEIMRGHLRYVLTGKEGARK